MWQRKNIYFCSRPQDRPSSKSVGHVRRHRSPPYRMTHCAFLLAESTVALTFNNKDWGCLSCLKFMGKRKGCIGACFTDM